MKKYIIYIALVLSFFSCKEDIKDAKIAPKETINSVKTNGTSEPNSEKDKRVIRASKVVTEEEQVQKKEKISKAKTDAIAKKRAELYAKNKKERDDYKKNGGISEDKKMIDMGNGVKIQKSYDFASYDLPDACSLLSEDWIASNFDVNLDEILVKNSSSTRTRYARSCFFKWPVATVTNGGIMLQLQKNPVPEFTTDWVKEFMEAKKKEGESMMDTPDIRMTYKDLPGLGDEAVHNYGLNRCFWRVGDELLFMLAFNLGLSKEEEKALAIKIGNEVTRNFKKNNK